MYDKAIQGMHDRLLQVSTPSNLVYIADRNSGKLDLKMDHLVCFMGGLLALGAYTDPQGLESERAQRDLKTGKVSRRKKEDKSPVLANLRLYGYEVGPDRTFMWLFTFTHDCLFSFLSIPLITYPSIRR